MIDPIARQNTQAAVHNSNQRLRSRLFSQGGDVEKKLAFAMRNHVKGEPFSPDMLLAIGAAESYVATRKALSPTITMDMRTKSLEGMVTSHLRALKEMPSSPACKNAVNWVQTVQDDGRHNLPDEGVEVLLRVGDKDHVGAFVIDDMTFVCVSPTEDHAVLVLGDVTKWAYFDETGNITAY
jgi:hypothetical protein